MKALFDALPRTNDNNLVLLDTCFFIDVFSRGLVSDLSDFCSRNKVALTSFNVEELLHVIKKNEIPHHVKDHIRHFIENNESLFVLELPVHPGNSELEKTFVENADPELLRHVKDPSDAVLAAAALLHKSVILTKDKHHLFTSELVNYLSSKKVFLLKEFNDIV